ncbi:MAG TPA: DegT/DnrJ/EryC1/StrS family aminotransferase [Chthoniobacterales bacterium]|nr:DegT/DnrJ/EryC1/StrS family aminotransferase [Chthoniobacterales bacterium]
MKVPFLDLNAHHAPLRAEFDRAIAEVIDAGAFAGGPFVTQFEEEFADFCACEHAVGLGSGTEALWLALLAFGVGAGDEVITVPCTFMATAEAITYCGAKPVFVDVDERTYTMDPAALEDAITARTKAIIPVHLFGQPADMDPIMEIARGRGLAVIEDAAQAHGAEYKGRRAGSIGDIGCFSFYPGKNLGAFGEAGAVVTNDAALRDTMRVLRDHGQTRKYHHTMVGWNCRMDGIQAAVLRIKLRHLNDNNALRRQHAAQYDRALGSVDGVVTPHAAEYAQHIYHIYATRVAERDATMRRLEETGIGCGVHYPVPVHLQEAYCHLNYSRGAFPVSECIASEFISLPMFPELTQKQVSLAAEAVKESMVAEVAA